MKTTVIGSKMARGAPDEVYCGRATRGKSGLFGNPVAIGLPCPVCSRTHQDAGSTIHCFRRYFQHRLSVDTFYRSSVHALKGKTLVCPGNCVMHRSPCHCKVIAEYLDTV